MFQVSFQFRSWCNNSGMRCRPQTRPYGIYPVSSLHQALQVLLHRYDQVVGLRNTSHCSVYEVKSDHRRRMFEGKWRRQTKVPRTFVKNTFSVSSTSSLTTVTSRSMATCSGRNEALPWDHQLLPLCAISLLRLSFFWHQTMDMLRFQMPDFGVIWHERYVDNRVILLRDAAPSTAVLRNFLSLVMLETQNDTKVLGYICDSASRTITPQLPDHPSQIKGIRSANDQMFTYSSWSSRSWLIVRGAHNRLALMLSNVFMKSRASTLTSYETSGDELHQNLHVEPLCAFGLFVASLLVHLCDCVHVCSWLGLCGCLLVGAFLCLGMAVYMVTSLLRPDGTVQTTSQVTLDQFPSFTKGMR